MNRRGPIVIIEDDADDQEILQEIFNADTGMAYIYVQHLSPHQKSLTTELLSKQTKMTVQEIQQMELIKPDNIYVIPNDKGIEVTDGHIKLISRDIKGVSNLSIDTLFISLAQTHTDEVIGVVLSGNASDGTQGLRAIRSEGGITFAQDDSAKYSSMPQSAISAGVVDFILSPQEIAINLKKLGKYFVKNGTLHLQRGKDMELTASDLKTVVRTLYDAVSVDFSLYKVNTVRRRILRRALLTESKTIKKYLLHLKENKEEVHLLHRDLLINFTCFFRETDTHDYLKKNIFPKLLKSRTTADPLRIWTVACSTGEEAYSVAMGLHEVAGKNFKPGKIQIFATDLSVHAIAKARTGVYTKEELKEVSPQRLARFFTEVGNGYKITKSIREMCVFAPHNVLTDPPFSRLDLICCCNMLIYLDIAAQQKIMTIFHYALKEPGFLVLGNSETVGASGYLFQQQHKKLKIFLSKKHSSKPQLKEIRTLFQTKPHKQVTGKQQSRNVIIEPGSLERKVESLFVNQFFPSSVVINYDLEVLLFKGSASPYLEIASGKASFNVTKMARPEIAFELRNAINKAMATKTNVKQTGIEITTGKSTRLIAIQVLPFTSEWEEPLLLVMFSDEGPAETEIRTSENGHPNPDKDNAANRKQAEQLVALKADMILMAQNHDRSVQQLQSANEEIVSANEELQSLNEELETSREEIESTNEELNTTIQELISQNQLLAESYQYSEDIIATIHEPMVVLDHDLNVKTANTSFYRLFDLKPEATEGKSFYRLNEKRWDIPELRILLERILKKNSGFQGFPVTFDLGKKGNLNLMLNAKRIIQKNHKKNLILLAMEDSAVKNRGNGVENKTPAKKKSATKV